MLSFLLLLLVASATADRDPRCARYKRGAQAQTLPHIADCTKFLMCDVQGNALEMKCPKNTYFSPKEGICTFDSFACSGAERIPEFKPAVPISNKPVVENSINDRVSVVKPTLPIFANINPVDNNKDRQKPPLPVINNANVVDITNKAPTNSGLDITVGLLKPVLPPIISPVPENNNKERAAALGPICKNQKLGVKMPMKGDCFSYVICIQEKPSVYTCPDGLAYDSKAAKCVSNDIIKCEVPKVTPKPTLPDKPSLTRPDPVVPPQTPILPMPQLPVVPPHAPTPENPVIPPHVPILPLPEPQAPILPMPQLPVIPPQAPILPTPELPVIPPQVIIPPRPELPIIRPEAPVLSTPELPIIAPQPPILPTPELPTIPMEPPKDNISGPIFMPYSAPRLVEDSRCSDRVSLNSSIMLPVPRDCSKYIVCLGSLAYEKQCPVGQHWSTERNYCDFIDRAKCDA